MRAVLDAGGMQVGVNRQSKVCCVHPSIRTSAIGLEVTDGAAAPTVDNGDGGCQRPCKFSIRPDAVARHASQSHWNNGRSSAITGYTGLQLFFRLSGVMLQNGPPDMHYLLVHLTCSMMRACHAMLDSPEHIATGNGRVRIRA